MGLRGYRHRAAEAAVLFGVLYLYLSLGKRARAMEQTIPRPFRSCETLESGFADAENPPLTDGQTARGCC